MIITAYGEARKVWRRCALYFQNKFGLSDNDMPNVSGMPRINTIDSSQGHEAPVVFLDCCVQDVQFRPRDLGFVDDDKRLNVAMTRAKEVIYLMGGSAKWDVEYDDNIAAYVACETHLEETGRCTKMVSIRIPDGSDWMSRIERKQTKLSKRYADDMTRLEEAETGIVEDRRILEWQEYAAEQAL